MVDGKINGREVLTWCKDINMDNQIEISEMFREWAELIGIDKDTVMMEVIAKDEHVEFYLVVKEV